MGYWPAKNIWGNRAGFSHSRLSNVSYIIGLLRNLKDATPDEQERQIKLINDLLDSEAQLRSKRELIDEFIAGQFKNLPPDADVGAEFGQYWAVKKQQAKVALAQEENLNEEGLENVIGDYIFTEKFHSVTTWSRLWMNARNSKNERRLPLASLRKLRALWRHF